MPITPVDYSSKDYSAFRADILSAVQQFVPDWTSRSASDLGMTLLESFCYLADILSYYEDRIANEAYIATAVQRSAVLAYAQMMDYKPRGIAGSTVTQSFTTVSVPGANVYIPKATQVSTTATASQSAIVFETSLDLTIPIATASTTTSTAIATHAVGDSFTITTASSVGFPTTNGYTIQIDTEQFYVSTGAGTTTLTLIAGGTSSHSGGATVSVVVTTSGSAFSGTIPATAGQTITSESVAASTGAASQFYSLFRTPVIDGSIVLSVNETGTATTWTRLDHLIDAASGDSSYTTYVDENNITWIQFGDSSTGRIPLAGATITATYRIGGGLASNVNAGTVTTLVSAVANVLTTTNTSAGSGGTDVETTDSIRLNAPSTFSAQNRAVTTADYASLALRVAGIYKSAALATVYSNVSLYLAPNFGTTVGLFATGSVFPVMVGATNPVSSSSTYSAGDYATQAMAAGNSVATQAYVYTSTTPLSGTFPPDSASTTVAAGSNGAVLPQGTINVASTSGFPSNGGLFVTSSNGTQTISYTGSTTTSFTGCTGGTGTLSTGGAVSLIVRSTTVAAGSNGVNVSTFAGAGVLNVASTLSFPNAGTINVVTSGTPAVITYTGTSGTTFTGCTTTSGTGTVATGGAVTATGTYWKACTLQNSSYATNVTTYLSSRKMANATVTNFDFNFRPVQITVAVQVYSTAVKETTRQAALTALNNLFAWASIVPGTSINQSTIYSTLLAVSGVQNATLSVLSKTATGLGDLTFASNEIPVAGTLTVTASGGL